MPEEEGGESLVHVAISAEDLFTIGPLTVTNSMIGALLTSAVLLLAAWYITRHTSLVPGRLQGASSSRSRCSAASSRLRAAAGGATPR